MSLFTVSTALSVKQVSERVGERESDRLLIQCDEERVFCWVFTCSTRSESDERRTQEEESRRRRSRRRGERSNLKRHGDDTLAAHYERAYTKRERERKLEIGVLCFRGNQLFHVTYIILFLPAPSCLAERESPLTHTERVKILSRYPVSFVSVLSTHQMMKGERRSTTHFERDDLI